MARPHSWAWRGLSNLLCDSFKWIFVTWDQQGWGEILSSAGTCQIYSEAVTTDQRPGVQGWATLATDCHCSAHLQLRLSADLQYLF